MQEFKVGDLVDIEHSNDSYSEGLVGCEIVFCGKEYHIVIGDDGREVPIYISAYTLKPHRKTQDWFGVEIDAFMTEKPTDCQHIWFFNNYQTNGLFHWIRWKQVPACDDLFGMGVWDSEEKAQRSAPLMRQRLIEVAGVSCKEK